MGVLPEDHLEHHMNPDMRLRIPTGALGYLLDLPGDISIVSAEVMSPGDDNLVLLVRFDEQSHKDEFEAKIGTGVRLGQKVQAVYGLSDDEKHLQLTQINVHV